MKKVRVIQVLWMAVVTAVLFTSCTSFNANKFNGYWALYKKCESGEMVPFFNGVIRLSNDTMYNFPLDTFNNGFCVLDATTDSMTLDRTCGIVRYAYSFNGEKLTFTEGDNEIAWVFKRIDSIDISIQRILSQTQLKIDLPQIKTSVKSVLPNQRIFYVGKELSDSLYTCTSQSDMQLNMDEEVSNCTSPELPQKIKLKYLDAWVQPCELKELLNVFMNEVGPEEKVSVIIAADKTVPQMVLNEIYSQFTHPQCQVVQMFALEGRHLKLAYHEYVRFN